VQTSNKLCYHHLQHVIISSAYPEMFIRPTQRVLPSATVTVSYPACPMSLTRRILPNFDRDHRRSRLTVDVIVTMTPAKNLRNGFPPQKSLRCAASAARMIRFGSSSIYRYFWFNSAVRASAAAWFHPTFSPMARYSRSSVCCNHLYKWRYVIAGDPEKPFRVTAQAT